MNILVIGNGFDLAHGLPTKYWDFLDWVKDFLELNSYNKYERERILRNVNKSAYGYFLDLFSKKEKENICKELRQTICDNGWIYYFLHCNMYQKENWIDFENEISKVIQWFDSKILDRSSDTLDAVGDDGRLINDLASFFKYNFSYDMQFISETIESVIKIIIERLLNDLNRFVRAFEIYLADYISKIRLEVISPDIVKITKGIRKGSYLKILNFNYTHTFERLYGNLVNAKYDFIHGSAKIANTIETNNMVLGIDEYLEKDRKNRDIDFIVFKKYFQRIYKETGCEYKNWIDEIKYSDKSKGKYSRRHHLYIFGHSLDVTDKDVLSDLILNDNVYTNIYYRNQDQQGQQIENLVKVIGQDELIKRTGGTTKTIDFRLQQKMISRYTSEI